MEIIFLILLIAFVLWVATAVLIFMFIFYTPRKIKDLSEEDLSKTDYAPWANDLNAIIGKAKQLDFHERFLLSRDHLRLFGLYLDKGSHKTVMFVSGYQASPFSNFSYQIGLFLKEGYNILMVYPRAHGPSEGRFTSFGIKESADIVDWVNKVALTEPNVEELVIYGTSMGGFALSLASKYLHDERIKALVVDCAFNSLDEMLREHFAEYKCPYKLYFLPFLITYRLVCGADYRGVSASKALAENPIPTFFIHGTADSTILFHHGVENAKACKSEHETCFVEGGTHTIALMQGAPKAVEELFTFIHKYVK